MLQNQSAVYVATYIDVLKNFANDGLSLLNQYRESSRRAQGSLAVDLVRESGRPNRFVIVEVWSDMASFEAHEQRAETAEFRTRLKRIHNSPYDQRVHQAFATATAGQAGRDALFVVTHVDVPPPRREECEMLLKRLAEDSRRDEGNVRYDVFQQSSRTNHFTVLAAWRDQAAYDSHEAKVHTREFREALGPMLGALYDERLYVGIG